MKESKGRYWSSIVLIGEFCRFVFVPFDLIMFHTSPTRVAIAEFSTSVKDPKIGCNFICIVSIDRENKVGRAADIFGAVFGKAEIVQSVESHNLMTGKISFYIVITTSKSPRDLSLDHRSNSSGPSVCDPTIAAIPSVSRKDITLILLK